MRLSTESGGRITATNIPLRLLIAKAYQLSLGQSTRGLIGLPAQINSERFDIETKAQGEPTPEQVALMLQALLSDRFKLAVHWETRQIPVYALVKVNPEKTGPQLYLHTDNTWCVPDNPRLPRCGGGFSSTFRHIAAEVTMDELAKNLSWFRQGGLDRAVLDRTGLTGIFDLTLDFQNIPQSGSADENAITHNSSVVPAISADLEDQLGLKLVPQTGPVAVLVIDHAEHPSPN